MISAIDIHTVGLVCNHETSVTSTGIIGIQLRRFVHTGSFVPRMSVFPFYRAHHANAQSMHYRGERERKRDRDRLSGKEEDREGGKCVFHAGQCTHVCIQ